MERCKGCGAPRWWSDSNWNVAPPESVDKRKCFGCMMDWETSEKDLEALRKMVWEAVIKLDAPERNMEYYVDLASRLAEIHDEIEDKLSVNRHFISPRYIQRPVDGTY